MSKCGAHRPPTTKAAAYVIQPRSASRLQCSSWSGSPSMLHIHSRQNFEGLAELKLICNNKPTSCCLYSAEQIIPAGSLPHCFLETATPCLDLFVEHFQANRKEDWSTERTRTEPRHGSSSIVRKIQIRTSRRRFSKCCLCPPFLVRAGTSFHPQAFRSTSIFIR